MKEYLVEYNYIYTSKKSDKPYRLMGFLMIPGSDVKDAEQRITKEMNDDSSVSSFEIKSIKLFREYR